jgi:hypothetical protein
MVLKRKNFTPQEYIQIGMAFFLIGLILSRIVDARLISAFFASVIPDKSSMDTFHGIAAGFSIPILCASIYFNVRGLIMLRPR